MLEDIKRKALKDKIPIMEDEGIDYLVDFIKKNQYKKILEIGTGVGYSALKMAKVDPEIQIISIEKDRERYQKAFENIIKMGLNRQISVVNDDALKYDVTGKYDLIFIDAAKSQYIKFFEIYSKHLKKDGAIVTDNLKFHGLVGSDKSKFSKNLRSLVTKIEQYNEFLKTNQEFETEFVAVGDGLGISRRKK